MDFYKRPAHIPPAFSLLEVAVVVVIIGVLGALAIPAMSGASERARASVVSAGVAEIDRAIERYRGEHSGRSPADEVDGSINTDLLSFRRRLTERSNEAGELGGDAQYGPYLQVIPKNPFSNCDWLRVDDASTRYGCSWLFDPTSGVVRADHMPNFWHDGEPH